MFILENPIQMDGFPKMGISQKWLWLNKKNIKNIKMDGLVYTIKTYKSTLKWMMTGGTPMTWESSICAADLGHHLQHGVKVLRHEFRLGRRLWSGEILENQENGCI